MTIFILAVLFILYNMFGNVAVATFICENGSHYSNNLQGIKIFELNGTTALCKTIPILR